MIAIIDYDIGNLKNVQTALKDVNLQGVITRNPQTIHDADAIILPGVGAFKDAMERLKDYHLIEVLERNRQKGKIILGICLGMQLLFDESDEDGCHTGLGYISGRVEKITGNHLKVPHMGWNNLLISNDDPIVRGITPQDFVYFVHSYHATVNHSKNLIAYAEYGGVIPAIIRADNIIGMQFHPEKSAAVGTKLLQNFKEVIA